MTETDRVLKPVPMSGAFAGLAKRLGVDLDAAVLAADTPTGQRFLSHAELVTRKGWSDETVCHGQLVVVDRAGPMWTVVCDACGFEAGLPERAADPAANAEWLIAHSGLPERFLSREFEKTSSANEFAKRSLWAWLGAESLCPAPAVWGKPGRGKALDVATPIPTPSGLSTMGDLCVGDHVYGSDGRPTQVRFVSEVQLDRECFAVRFSDGACIIADAEHTWTITDHAARLSAANRNRRAGVQMELGSRATRIDQSTLWKQRRNVTTVELKRLVETERKKPSIACAPPIERPSAPLPIDPYVFGVWLGDGDSARPMITAHLDDAGFYAGQFVAAGETIGKFDADVRRPTTGRFYWGYERDGRGTGAKARLRALGVLGQKHIPDIYMNSSVSQRLALLQGLVDSDGSVTEHGGVEFCVTSERLASDVLDLALGLGLRTTSNESAAVLQGREVGRRWRLKWTTSLPVARLPRKAARLRRDAGTRATHRYVVAVEPVASRPMKCIQVDAHDHLYLAGREYVATHNTHLFVVVCRELMVRRQAPVLFRTAPQLLSDLQAAMNTPRYDELWREVITAPLLALDDLGAEMDTDWKTECVSSLVDARYRADLPLAITTNVAPDRWGDAFDARTASRLREMTFALELVGDDRRVNEGTQLALAAVPDLEGKD